MKKFIILLITALMVNLSVNAQETSKKFGLLDKWSVGFETAIQTNLHDWNKPQGLILGVTLNKDINPYYGLSVETTIGFNNRKNYNLEIINADKPIDQITVSLINRWNITNTIYGYNGTPHKFEVEMLVGLGGLHDFGDSFVYLWGPGTKFEDHTSHITNQRSAVIAKTGFNLNYNINKHWSISAQPSIVWDLSKRWEVIPDWYLFGYGRIRDERFNNKFNSQKAVFQMMVSATYHINFKKHNNKELCNYSQEEVNTLSNEINDMKKKTELEGALSNSTDSIR